jgi:hypothetical protein
MKTVYISIILFFFTILNCSAQETEHVYIEMNDDFKIIKSQDQKNVLQSYLFVRKNNFFDSYYFNIQTDFKNFKGSEKKICNKKFILFNESEYKNMSPCELHEFFSDNKIIYLVYKKDDNFYGWGMLYEGTSKNTIKSVQTTRI